MRFGFILLILTIGLLGEGAQGLYTAASNRSIKQYTIDEYLRSKPSDKWLKLTGGTLDLTHLNYISFLKVGTITEIYIPLRSRDSGADDQVHILLFTKDPVLLHLAEGMRKVKDEEQALRFLRDHAHELIVSKDVQGLARFSNEFDDREMRKLRKVNGNLASDCIIISDGVQPEYLAPAGMLIGGVALAGFMIARLLDWKSKPPGSSLPPPLPGTNPPPLPVVR